MKTIVMLAAATMLSLSAAAQNASDATIERLMTVMRSEKMVEALQSSMDTIMDSAVKSTVTEPLPPEQQRRMDTAVATIKETMHAEFTWDRLKPRFVSLYKETFTDEEIQGLIAFYESPAGQALLAKMPLLMQRSMALTQEQMRSMIPRMKSAIEDAAAQARAGS